MLQAVFEALKEGNSAKTFERLDFFWARLAMHIRAEHLHLFPLIIQDVGSRVGLDPSLSLKKVIAAVETLRADHNFFMSELGRAIKLARKATYTREQGQIEDRHNEVQKILNVLVERLKTHNELEEQIVYRLPKRVMTAPRQSLLAAQVSQELANPPQRFAVSEREASVSSVPDGE